MADRVETFRVHWADVDAGGGAHHGLASRWAEQAEHALLRSVGLSPRSFPRRRVEVDFLRPLRLDDCFDVELSIDRLGQTSAVYSWAGVRAGEVCFRGRTVVVHVDEDGRAVSLPRELRDFTPTGSPNRSPC